MIDITASEGGLIAIQIIRILFIDRLHIFVQHAGMQQVILIQQTDILPCGHLQTGIGIPCNAVIFIQMPVENPSPGSCGVFSADIPDITMCPIGTIRKTKLPVAICLIHHRIQHLNLKFPGIIP